MSNKNVVILNLTQHAGTEEQKQAGVVDLPPAYTKKVKEALTFNTVPTREEIVNRANEIKRVVLDFLTDEMSPLRDEAREILRTGKMEEMKKFELGFMIGGAPFFMGPLAQTLKEIGEPLYAFSRRVVEEKHVNGEVVKTAKFRHEGFVPASIEPEAPKPSEVYAVISSGYDQNGTYGEDIVALYATEELARAEAKEGMGLSVRKMNVKTEAAGRNQIPIVGRP